MKQFTINSFYKAIKDDFFKLGFDEGAPLPHNGVIEFYKSNRKYLFEYNCNIADGYKTKFAVSSTFYVRIILKEVNDILFQFIPKKGNEQDTVYDIPNYDLHEEELAVLDDMYIKTEEDFESVKNILLGYVERRVLPFYDEIQSVQDVNDKIINTVGWDNINNYIPSQFGLKTLIIMYLCKNEKFHDYKKFIDKNREKSLKNPELQSYIPLMLKQKELFNKVYDYLISL